MLLCDRAAGPGDRNAPGREFLRGYIDQGTPGVVIDERSFLGFDTTYEVAFEVDGRIERRGGLDEHDIAPV
jgi:hypothetical protein